MKESKTCRGFELIEFIDRNGEECSLQESSLAVMENEDGSVDNPNGYIWLGIDDAKSEIMKSKAEENGLSLEPGEEISGWMPYPIPKGVFVSTRMHLNEHQIKSLVEKLQLWLDTGSLHK